MALMVDLRHGVSPARAAEPLLAHAHAHIFLLRRAGDQDPPLPAWCADAQLLDCDSTAESLYRLKRTVDRLDLNLIRVCTSQRGREELTHYQRLLFTAVYTFEWAVTPAGDVTDAHHAPQDLLEESRIGEEVSGFLQRLPAESGEVRVLRSALIPDCFGHGFSTRTGGLSYISTLSSMNLFSSSRRRDPVAVVTENRRRLALHAGFHPQSLRQVKVNHASDVWVLGTPEPESYDGVVTDRKGVVIAAPGADCMPILFCDPVKKVIGAAHAGWKGTLMGVAMATVNAMASEFGSRVSDVVVAVGPSVDKCCFVLDREQALDFSHIHQECVPDPEAAQPHVDIRLANRLLLQRGGVLPENIHDNTSPEMPSVTPCTSCHPDDFFSHVRDGLNFGTQIGFIWIQEVEEQHGSRG